MRLRVGYLLVALAIFAVEVLIALFVRDAVVRPIVGDALAVVLVYAGLRAVTPLGPRAAIAVALGIAFAIEALQGLRLLERLGVPPGGVLGVVLGATFDPRDLLAYLGGAAAIALVEGLRARRRR